MVTLSVDGRGRPTAGGSGADWYDPREGGPSPSVNGKYIRYTLKVLSGINIRHFAS